MTEPAPVDEGRQHAAVDEVAHCLSDPSFVEGGELGRAHLAARHGELAMGAAGDVARDADVVGLVGEHEASHVALHEAVQGRGVARISADDAVRPHEEHVARARHRRMLGLGHERSRLHRRRRIGGEDPVDLRQLEAADLDRRVVDDQLLELQPQLLELPAAVLAQTVRRDAQQLELGRRQRVDGDAGDGGQVQELGCLDAHHAVDQPTLAIDEHRGCEAEGGDRVGDPAHVVGLDLPHVASGRDQKPGIAVDELQLRQEVVSSARCDRGRAGQALRLRPAPAVARGEACLQLRS